MICPILRAIEILDEATDILEMSKRGYEIDRAPNKIVGKMEAQSRVSGIVITYITPRANANRLYALSPRLLKLKETTDCPIELLVAIADFLMNMARTHNIVQWKGDERIGMGIYNPGTPKMLDELLRTP